MEWQLSAQNQILHNLQHLLLTEEPLTFLKAFWKWNNFTALCFNHYFAPARRKSAIFTLREHLSTGLNSVAALGRVLIYTIHVTTFTL